MSPNDTFEERGALENMAETLEAHDDYRVLRRLERPTVNEDGAAATDDSLGKALFVDVETTGLDQAADEVIELAIVPFAFRKSDGAVLEIGDGYSGLAQPSAPLDPKVTAITGLTDADLDGQSLDMGAVRRLGAEADLVLAHNAGFDRPFLERLDPLFAEKHWACSMAEVSWTDEGFDGRGLRGLALQSGFFFDGHRAENDCLAAIELLARDLPRSGVPAMAQLLDAARTKTWRLWAIDSPFDAKERLKARGYRWNGDGQPRAWNVTLSDVAALSDEAAFLRESVYKRDAAVTLDTLTARDRYRLGPPRRRETTALSAL